jgi:pyrroline-5-carboxylate reductase
MGQGVRLAFIGGGNMAGFGGDSRGAACAAGGGPRHRRHDDRLACLKTTYGIGVSSDNAEAARHAETDPCCQAAVMSRALDDLRRVADRQLVISIAAAFPPRPLRRRFFGRSASSG